jgi:hypothetical protein
MAACNRNTLLLAAGFAPVFSERSVTELEAAKAAIDSVLRSHAPYPAFAVDRHWNIVASNAALPQLYEGCFPQRDLQAFRQATDHLPARLGLAGLQTRQMPGRTLGRHGEIRLCHAPLLPPSPEQHAEGHMSYIHET